MPRPYLASAVLLLLLCSLTGFCAAQDSPAEEPVDWSHRTILGIQAGAQFPRSDFEDYYGWSYGGGASLGRMVGTNAILSVGGSFHHFGEGGMGHVGSVIPVTLNADYAIPSGFRRLVVGVGAGLYHVAESGSGRLGFPDTQNAFGVNARLGVMVPASRTVAIAPTFRFHYVKTNRLIANVAYAALQLDVNVGL